VTDDALDPWWLHDPSLIGAGSAVELASYLIYSMTAPPALDIRDKADNRRTFVRFIALR